MDRIIKNENTVIISQDKTRYKSVDVTILYKWYPNTYKTMKLLNVFDEDGYINYEFALDNCKEFNLSGFTVLEKLYCAYSLFSYESIFTNGFYTSFDDENLYLDASNCAEAIFVEDVDLYIDNANYKDFFTQLKAKILSMFSKYTYNEIIKSNFTLSFSSKFEKEILNSKDVQELRETVVKHIDEQETIQKSNFAFVKKKSFIMYRAFTYILLVMFLVMTTYSVFNKFYTVNKLEFSNDLYGEFIDKNYTEVLRISSGEDLTLDQKYIVGYAGIMTTALDNDKKEIILSTYSKHVSEALMEYWIYIGYGDYKNAINKGKSINNDEYVLYALRLEENRLLKDEKMDGAQKEAELNGVQSEIETYKEKLNITDEVDDDE